MRICSKAAPPEKFGVDFGKFSQHALKLQMSGDASARFLPLLRRFEQKLSHLAGPQALNEVIERTVLVPPLAATVLFAACQVMLDVGGTQQIAR